MTQLLEALSKIDATGWIMLVAAVSVALWGNWDRVKSIVSRWLPKPSPSPLPDPETMDVTDTLIRLVATWQDLNEAGEGEAAREVAQAIVALLGLADTEVSK